MTEESTATTRRELREQRERAGRHGRAASRPSDVRNDIPGDLPPDHRSESRGGDPADVAGGRSRTTRRSEHPGHSRHSRPRDSRTTHSRTRPLRHAAARLLGGPWGIPGLWLLTHVLVGGGFLARFGPDTARWNGLLVAEPTAYLTGLGQLGRIPFDRVLPELPVPTVRLLEGLSVLTGGSRTGFLVAIAGIAVAADLTVLVLLLASRSAGPIAAAYWALAVPLVGPVAYARLDLAVVAVIAVAWVLAPRRPGWAGAALGLACALALRPVLVLLPVLSRATAGARRRLLLGYAALLALAVAVTVPAGGWGRLGTPITRGLASGLQVESVPATPALVDVAIEPGRHTASVIGGELVVRGTWVSGLLTVSLALVVVAVALAVALGVAGLRGGLEGQGEEIRSSQSRSGAERRRSRGRRDAGVRRSALVAVAGLLALLVASRLLAAEFLLWPLPLLAVLAARRSGPAPWAALGVAALTQLDYPYLFYGLNLPSAPGFDLATAAVLARNAGLVWLTGWAVLAAVRDVTTSAPGRGSRGIRPVARGQ